MSQAYSPSAFVIFKSCGQAGFTSSAGFNTMPCTSSYQCVCATMQIGCTDCAAGTYQNEAGKHACIGTACAAAVCTCIFLLNTTIFDAVIDWYQVRAGGRSDAAAPSAHLI